MACLIAPDGFPRDGTFFPGPHHANAAHGTLASSLDIKYRASLDIECGEATMAIKRIIDGHTYNTETAIQVGASSTDHGEPGGRQEQLYMSRAGRYFLIRLVRHDAGELAVEGVKPMSRHEAKAWYVGEGIGDPRGWFGQDAEDSGREAVISLRVARPLLHYLTVHAENMGRSRNAWINGALEEQLRLESEGRYFVQAKDGR